MSWRKDLKSNPKKEDYFPLRFGGVVKLAKESQLVHFDRDRLTIRIKNSEVEREHGHLLIDIMPEEGTAIYSLTT